MMYHTTRVLVLVALALLLNVLPSETTPQAHARPLGVSSNSGAFVSAAIGINGDGGGGHTGG